MKPHYIALIILILLTTVGVISLVLDKSSKKEVVVVKSVIDSIPKEPETMYVSTDTEWIQEGRILYRKNCAACHSFSRDLAGPKITDHITYGKIYNIIKSINRLEASRDPYTLMLIKEWDVKSARMPEFETYLTDKEIQKIVAFIKDENSRVICTH